VGAKKVEGRFYTGPLYYWRILMNLKFYQADEEYCAFLQKADPCVPYIQVKKGIRPFVGIVLTINGLNYFAPLTSPKPKHQKMKNQIDFLKIKAGEWGAINFNNMIPIHSSSLTVINMEISEKNSKADIDYKNLLTNQLTWCNANKVRILSQAGKLYQRIVSKQAYQELEKRCCNFLLVEEQYHIYCNLYGIT